MIIMDIRLDNIFAFKNFHANFSYPKKIVNTTIEGEYLKDFTNFRYKKVNVLMGSNATGKTTFGKALVAIFNYLKKNNPTYLVEAANLKNGDASASIDFVAQDTQNMTRLYRARLRVTHSENDNEPVVLSGIRSVLILKNESYEMCAEKLDEMEIELSEDKRVFINGMGWYFSDIDSKYLDKTQPDEKAVFLKVLNKVMPSFDSFIQQVTPIEEDDLDSLLIKFKSGESIIYHHGEAVGKDILSKGTASCITIAQIITNVMLRRNGFYYIDEKFCFVQSDIEKTVLSVLTQLLGDDQQLFFTTHNTDVLDMNFPKHTYSFFRKDVRNIQQPISLISASKYLKKQSDSLRNAVENDLFSCTPNDEKIFEILELQEGLNE